mmetsp:Transcript_8563/g.25472  ORF Transcript_8563/g.25472 Transcript_8563/m.25472 type:complete len:291 (-) Transcript_8563:1400-2272(-)
MLAEPRFLDAELPAQGPEPRLAALGDHEGLDRLPQVLGGQFDGDGGGCTFRPVWWRSACHHPAPELDPGQVQGDGDLLCGRHVRALLGRLPGGGEQLQLPPVRAAQRAVVHGAAKRRGRADQPSAGSHGRQHGGDALRAHVAGGLVHDRVGFRHAPCDLRRNLLRPHGLVVVQTRRAQQRELVADPLVVTGTMGPDADGRAALRQFGVREDLDLRDAPVVVVLLVLDQVAGYLLVQYRSRQARQLLRLALQIEVAVYAFWRALRAQGDELERHFALRQYLLEPLDRLVVT